MPNYRMWRLQVRGNFLGPFHRGNPSSEFHGNVTSKCPKKYNEYQYRFSIASVEAAIAENENGMVQLETGGLALSVGKNVYTNMTCTECWAEFGLGNLVELLNAVRNRILDFALALWKENPIAGELNTKDQKSLSQDKVTHWVNQTFYTENSRWDPQIS